MKKILLIIILVTLPSILTAQDTLSFRECQQLALRHNKEIASATSKITQMRHTVKSCKGYFFPNIYLSATGLYSNASGNYSMPEAALPTFTTGADGSAIPNGGFAFFPAINLQYETGPIFTGGIMLEQPIYMGGKIKNSYEMSKIGLYLAEANKEKTSSEVIVATSRAYSDVIKAQEILIVTQQYKKLLEELLRTVESAINHGMRTSNEALKVKVRINEAELSIRKAENALRLTKMNLCHIIGKDLNSEFAVSLETDPFYNIDIIPSASADMIANRPEHKMLGLQTEYVTKEIAVSRSELLPQIGLQAGYSYNYGLEINDHRLLDNGAFSVALNVSIPLFHFGATSQKVKAQQARLLQAELQKEYISEKLMLELTQSANNLDQAFLELQLAESSITEAEENRRISLSRYESGMETLSDCLEAQLLWQQASQSAIEAKFNLAVCHIDYLRASGRLPLSE